MVLDYALPVRMTLAADDGAAGLEAELVEKSRNGDGEAFGRLVRLHERRVFRLAGRFWRRREDVEDAAQETFLTAWRKLDRYSAKAPFEHWLTRVCLNTCYERLRRKRLPEQSLDDEVREPAAPGADPSAAADVERLLARLAPGDRFVLLLLDGEGWSTEEIAERLGWTRTNVKVRAHRARRRLRAVIEEDAP